MKIPVLMAETRRYRGALRAWKVVAFLVAVFAVPPSAPVVQAASPGPAPDFRLPLLTARGTIGLADLRSRPAILLFWAPW